MKKKNGLCLKRFSDSFSKDNWLWELSSSSA